MRIIWIRDPHSKDDYRKINGDDWDIIFCPWDMVDIHDSRYNSELWKYEEIDRTPEERRHQNSNMVNCLEWVLEMKYKFGKKMILILWNHDCQYIRDGLPKIEWFFRDEIFDVLNNIYMKNLQYFDFAVKIDNVIFSHWWFTKKFENYYNEKNEKLFELFNFVAPVDTDVWYCDKSWKNTNNMLLMREFEKYDMSSQTPNWPLWTHSKEIKTNPIYWYTQMFWHHWRWFDISNDANKSRVVCVDNQLIHKDRYNPSIIDI